MRYNRWRECFRNDAGVVHARQSSLPLAEVREASSMRRIEEEYSGDNRQDVVRRSVARLMVKYKP